MLEYFTFATFTNQSKNNISFFLVFLFAGNVIDEKPVSGET